MAIRRRPVRPNGAPRVCIVRQVDVYEPMIRREAEALAEAGFEVEVICMRSADRARREVINGVTVTSMPTSRTKGSKVRYLVDYASFFALAGGTLALRHLRRPYSAVQVNTMPDFLVFAAAVPWLLGSRVVAYMHEPSPELAETVYGPGRTVRVLAAVEQRVLRFADHSIAVTSELKQRFVERGARGEDISVVLNCVDPKSMRAGWTPPDAPPDGTFTLVCHGTIEERYGQFTIVDAVRLARERLPDLRVVFTGRGSGVDELRRRITAAGLDDVVRFEGWVSEARLNDILHSASAGIVAQESSPYSHLVQTNKMVDYWIFGLPVIASRLRSVAGMYDDSVLEYFEPGDATALADAMVRLHDDPERRAELAANGIRAHERFGWAVQKSAYLDVFAHLAR
jgi:glycosyltransferase involved in cell wall biosynthesis